jgi:hypothetical protein
VLAYRADSTGRRDTSDVEVPEGGTQQATGGDVADARQDPLVWASSPLAA